MAYDFDGTNDKLELINGVSGIDLATFTLVIGVVLDTIAAPQGFIAAGRDGTADEVCWQLSSTTTGQIRFTYFWTTTDGVWQFNDFTEATGEQYNVVVKYDRGLTTNDAVMFIAGLKKTVGSGLATITPVGSAETGQDSIRVGENMSGGNDFDGRAGEIAIYSELLADDICLELSNGYSPEFHAKDRVVHWPLKRSLVDVNQEATLAATGATVFPHLDMKYPRRKKIMTAPAVILTLARNRARFASHLAA